ncbi:serine--tRNA ligase [Gammaproteobacteria bacterium 42_54_T18]|nr:serine--tRNA ligase [Gammaproteobacteria bacterium 42_54_T18]
MLNLRYIIDNQDEIRLNISRRKMNVDLDKFLELYQQAHAIDRDIQETNRRANEHAASLKAIKGRPSAEELQTGRDLKELRDNLRGKLCGIETELSDLHGAIPNLIDPRVPDGATDEENVVREYGITARPEFDFEVRDHVQLGELHDLFDFASGSRVAGQGFYYLKGDAVRLDLALQLYAIDILELHGFTVHTTPDMARLEVIASTGYNPRGEESQIYSIDGTDLGLIATSEITLAGIHADTLIDERELPILMGGLSHCFRKEAGGSGRGTRGLYRVHQFSKVEMFAFSHPDQAEDLHEKILDIEKEIFDGLGIHYRVVENATGDLGASAYRKFDMEAWMPGRDSYGEVTSVSNCTDYQARRMKVRMRSSSTGKSAGLVHTLNGTAIATGRAMLSVLETYQEGDGSIRIPEPLQAVMGKDKLSV